MGYTSIDFVKLFSAFMSALSVIGLAALTIGPWAEPSATTGRTTLILAGSAFWMINLIATNVGALLATQADQIAALQRQLGHHRTEV